MSVNVKQNGELVKVANNISIVQANWNETDDSKVACIRNKPETLKTINEINENTDENALAGATVIKELIETGAAGGGCNIVYLTKAEYEALPDSKLTDDVEYRITDANTAAKIAATDVTYGDSTVEEVIDEVQESVSTLSESLECNDVTNKFSFNSGYTPNFQFAKEINGVVYISLRIDFTGTTTVNTTIGTHSLNLEKDVHIPVFGYGDGYKFGGGRITFLPNGNIALLCYGSNVTLTIAYANGVIIQN